MANGRGYTAIRRKPWYPRKKQPRWLAKLGRWERGILCWLAHDATQTFYLQERDAYLAQLLTEGLPWTPQCVVSTRALTPVERASLSRALHQLAARGIVERVPYPNSGRTARVKLTRRGATYIKGMCPARTEYQLGRPPLHMPSKRPPAWPPKRPRRKR